MFYLLQMAKRTYGAWSQEDLTKAIEACQSKKYGFNEACRVFNIPKPTLNRHLKNKNTRSKKKAFGRLTVFPAEVEEQLVSHILRLEEHMFGITIRDVRKLAFQLADRNNLPHNFNLERQMAGKCWYYAFMKRHAELSLRQPESTSMARVKGFNKESVYKYFDILEKIVDDYQLDATRIFNVDESGFSTVQKKNQKILAKKGKNQVGIVSSGERGVNTTIVCCFSASGLYVPPMVIFKRKRDCQDLKAGAVPGSIVTISDTGYINSELFVRWLQHFISVVNPTTERKVLLLLDGHSTHSKNLAALELARDNGIIMLQLPSHTTHKLQPLDVAFFKPLETFYTQEIEMWLRSNPGLCVTQKQVTQLLANAYARAATLQSAYGGFRATGAWPVNRHVFQEHDFVAAEALTEPDLLDTAEAISQEDTQDKLNVNTQEAEIIEEQETVQETDAAEETEITEEIEENEDGQPQLNVSVEDIIPLPKCVLPTGTKKVKRSTQGAAILTSTPNKEELEAAKLKRQKNVKSVKRKISGENDVVSRPGSSKVAQKVSGKIDASNTPGNSKGHERAAKDIHIEVNLDEWYCAICEKAVLEDMVQCLKCKKWYHEVCALCKPGKKNILAFSAKHRK